MKNDNEQRKKNIEFFKSQPTFCKMTVGKIQALMLTMKKVELERNQVVFKEGQKPVAVYIVCEGVLEYEKKLENGAMTKAAVLNRNAKKLEDTGAKEHLISKKMPHMKDFPMSHKISKYERGTMVGDLDVLMGVHQGTLRCYS